MDDAATIVARERYPAGVPCWVDTEQPDPKAAAHFYSELFGWTCEDRAPVGSSFHYFLARLHGLEIAGISSLEHELPDDGAPAWFTYVAVDDVDATAAQVEAAGGAIVTAPVDVNVAGRMATFRDPLGAELRLWQPNQRLGARLVNVPNTWNWSDLETTDVSRARTFYETVFGWDFVQPDPSDPTTFMVCRPGYADVLAERDPDLRRRHRDAGAPPGFSDAIAWMTGRAPHRAPDARPRWTVTFAVDDVDGVAERAVRLGGTVVVEPFDAPPVRAAVLRDPQGAELGISRYDATEAASLA